MPKFAKKEPQPFMRRILVSRSENHTKIRKLLRYTTTFLVNHWENYRTNYCIQPIKQEKEPSIFAVQNCIMISSSTRDWKKGVINNSEIDKYLIDGRD